MTLRRWTGSHTWGVGMASGKATLLLDTEGEYELSVGSIDTTDLPAVHHVLVLMPDEATMVLRSDVNLSVPVNGNVVTQADSVSGPVRIEFDVTAA